MGTPEARKEIGEIFRVYLTKRGFTQTHVAELLKQQFPDVARSESHLSQVKKGKGKASVELLDALDVVLNTGGEMGAVYRRANTIGPPKTSQHQTSQKHGGDDTGFSATVVSLIGEAYGHLWMGDGPVVTPIVGPFRHFYPVHVHRSTETTVFFGFEFGAAVTARWYHKRRFTDVFDLALWVKEQTDAYWQRVARDLKPNIVYGDPFYNVFIDRDDHTMTNEQIQATVRLTSSLPQLALNIPDDDGYDGDPSVIDLTREIPGDVFGGTPFSSPRLSYGHATSDGLAYYKQCRSHALPVKEVVAAAIQIQAAVLFIKQIRQRTGYDGIGAYVLTLRQIDLDLRSRIVGSHMGRYQRVIDALYNETQISERVRNAIEHVTINSRDERIKYLPPEP